MIVVIRISGKVGVRKTQEGSLDSLMLRRKYAAVLLNDKELPVLNSIRELVTFGDIDDATLKELLTKRGKAGKKLISNAD